MIIKNNYLYFLSYSGSCFSKYKPKKLKANEHPPLSLEKFIKTFLARYFKDDLEIKFAVTTTDGTNAMLNPVSVRMKYPNIRITNSHKFNFILNYSLSKFEKPIRILNILKMPGEFCAHNSALCCNYIFRFTTNSSPSICEYPIVSCLRSTFQAEILKKKLENLNRLFALAPYENYSDEENFLRRKFKVEPLYFELKCNTEKFLGDRNKPYNDTIHTLEIKNFPIYLTPMVKEFLASLFVEANEEKLIERLKTTTTESADLSAHFLNLNGLFLTNVIYSSKYLDVKNLNFNIEN